MTTLLGKYQFDRADHLDEYLEGLGVGLVLRKVQSVAKPVVEFTFLPDTEEWQITTESPFKHRTVRFKLGQPFEDETYDARKCRTTARKEGDKIVLEQLCDEGPPVVVTHEAKGPDPDGKIPEELLVTMSSGSYQTLHYFLKVTVPVEGEA